MDQIPKSFCSIWIVICRANVAHGDPLRPHYIAAVSTDRPTNVVQIGAPKLLNCRVAPYPTGPQCLLVTIDANELIGCHLVLGWRLPERIIDLSVEYRNATNGIRRPFGAGLVGALICFGRPAVDGMDFGTSPEAVARKLSAVSHLFRAMCPTLDLGRALLRGRYMCAVAHIEALGVPVDLQPIQRLRSAWPAIHDMVVKLTDQEFGVCSRGRFQPDAFESWLERKGFSWPRTALGNLDLSDGSFRDMSRLHPELRPLKELLWTISNFDPRALEVGRDGRNRTRLRPFSSRTSRNQPSSKASVLGNAAWVRNLVRPAPGKALAWIDWSQQEFGIAAALSGDSAMLAAYKTGDPYMAFAIKASAAPIDATASTHADVRELFKACVLGVQYGMGASTLARLTSLSEVAAQQLLSYHRSLFSGFWHWSDGVESRAWLLRRQTSVFGWQTHITDQTKPGFVRNFPMQANGAEMLRLACCLATENGIDVCAPLHDALLIEADEKEIHHAVDIAQQSMSEASNIVLDGFALRTTCRLIPYPQRFGDHRGAVVWSNVEQAINGLGGSSRQRQPAHLRNACRARAHSRPIYLYGFTEEEDASD